MVKPYRGVFLVGVTQAPLPFLTLAEVKEWLEIDHSDRDTMLTSMIAAACKMIDGYDGMIGKAVMTQQLKISFEDIQGDDHFELPLNPARSLDAITYFVDGVETPLDVLDFRLLETEDVSFVEPNAGVTWPDNYDDRHDAFSITYKAGFGDIVDVPEDIKTAGKQLVASMYENREAVSDLNLMPVPFGMQTIIDKYKVGWVA